MLNIISILGLSDDRRTLTVRAYTNGSTPSDAHVFSLSRDGGWLDEDIAEIRGYLVSE